jgi:hypothetical protein
MRPLLLASLGAAAAAAAQTELPANIGRNGGFGETLLEPAAGVKPHILFLLIVRVPVTSAPIALISLAFLPTFLISFSHILSHCPLISLPPACPCQLWRAPPAAAAPDGSQPD